MRKTWRMLRVARGYNINNTWYRNHTYTHASSGGSKSAVISTRVRVQPAEQEKRHFVELICVSNYPDLERWGSIKRAGHCLSTGQHGNRGQVWRRRRDSVSPRPHSLGPAALGKRKREGTIMRSAGWRHAGCISSIYVG